MKIIGKRSNRTYDVKYSLFGWSYATPVIFQRVYFLGIPLWYKRIELPHDVHDFQSVKEWGPIQLEKWFKDSINRYEEYHQKWNQFDSFMKMKFK